LARNFEALFLIFEVIAGLLQKIAGTVVKDEVLTVLQALGWA
jgi:hypothetical protein